MTTGRRYAPPVATYRLQMHRGFGFAEARALLPYLEDLGISHLYLSPIFTARPGSEHGYDVIDHNQVNPELGGLTGLYELGEELVARDMGLVLDIVPNHVGIGGSNPWWRDVLRYGQQSRFAPYFDIDWDAQPQLATGVLVIPVLGKPFGRALEDGELKLDLDDGEIVVRYWNHVLPIAPQRYGELIGLPPVELRDGLRDPAAFANLVDLLEELPRADPERSEVLLGRWKELVASEPGLERFLRGVFEQVNGRVGDPASFDRLERLLLSQHYRLADWRVSGEELNYRRFFDVNDLAGIRVEREDVFEAVHGLLFQLVERGLVTGVRVDHVDGLYDPAQYLERLQARLAEAARAHTPDGIPIYVEKILEGSEELDGSWPVAGTTGYEFLARVDGLLVNPGSRVSMDATYRRFTGSNPRLDRISYHARLELSESAFAGEINVLALQLHRIAQRHRLHRDNTLRSLQQAIRGVLASFPVYRTYVTGDPRDDEYLREALDLARRHDPGLSEGALDFLARVLLLDEEVDEDERARRVHFRRRFQQLSGPIMAKGLEDTSLYRYNRLISLNEVGGDPARLGIPPDEVHRWFAARAERWPHAMSASSTHDTKRSEDVRARIHVLSEAPDEWRREVLTWQRLNERHRGEAGGEAAPSPNLEYYLYQTLVGTWQPDSPTAEYRERMRTHLTKAMREAKVETSWTQVNEAYESASLAFLDAILDRRRAGAFQRRLRRFVDRIRAAGELNARTGLVLKALAPGFPDFYQGTECEALTLTDPDNRRPVDFEASARLLRRVERRQPDLLSPAGKLWLSQRLLRLRCSHAQALAGGYEPVPLAGSAQNHLFAFRRIGDGSEVVAIVPRLTLALMHESGRIAPGAWGDTRIAVGSGAWCETLGGQRIATDGELLAGELLAERPLAILVRGASDGQ
ncbi:MAG: malto-oligosyltrehalose synthase [Hyphomicrobiales bacterium]